MGDYPERMASAAELGIDEFPDSDELKPCPFCGEAHNLKDYHDPQWGYRFTCKMCRVSGPPGKDWDEGLSEWNRRVYYRPDPSPEAISRDTHRSLDGIEASLAVLQAAEIKRLRAENAHLRALLASHEFAPKAPNT